jgi:hypothetical protein
MSIDRERGRGRTSAKLNGLEIDSSIEESREEEREERKKSALGRFSSLLGLDGEENKESGDGWKEFKKGACFCFVLFDSYNECNSGIYTYPISIAIPGNSPPSITCRFGSVSWHLKANVHRPGLLTPKLNATREVILVAAPEGGDTEDTGNIIVDQVWDSQLRYVISISGKSFPIGGVMPVHFKLVPFAKVKVYRITLILEGTLFYSHVGLSVLIVVSARLERVFYYSVTDRVMRTDPPNDIVLLSLKFPPKGDGEGDPILPLTTSFEQSPLYTMLTPDDDPMLMASTFMGPGPWTFHHDLQLPSSCTRLHFTNRNPASNIAVTHTIKTKLRAQRGDDQSVDPKTGKPRMFDLVMAKPIHILSVSCHVYLFCAFVLTSDDSVDVTWNG